MLRVSVHIHNSCAQVIKLAERVDPGLPKRPVRGQARHGTQENAGESGVYYSRKN